MKSADPPVENLLDLLPAKQHEDHEILRLSLEAIPPQFGWIGIASFDTDKLCRAIVRYVEEQSPFPTVHHAVGNLTDYDQALAGMDAGTLTLLEIRAPETERDHFASIAVTSRDYIARNDFKALFILTEENLGSFYNHAYDLYSVAVFRANFNDETRWFFQGNEVKKGDSIYQEEYEEAKRFLEELEAKKTARHILVQQLIKVGDLARRIGAYEEAFDYFQSAEKRADPIQDVHSLANAYNNQAVILYHWGRLKEAMRLHKKAEAIFQDLGDRRGLARSYGNQAFILRHWGKLDEAMQVHAKEERIKEALGDRRGLAKSYGNQGIILRRQESLEEAMRLHKKAEAIYREFRDRQGLAISYGNQGVILKSRGELEEAMRLHKKAEVIFKELGDRQGLARSYGNQAVILYYWGRLEEAMRFYQESEAVFKDLGDRRGLATSHAEQTEILKQRKRHEEAEELSSRTESIRKSLA